MLADLRLPAYQQVAHLPSTLGQVTGPVTLTPTSSPNSAPMLPAKTHSLCMMLSRAFVHISLHPSRPPFSSYRRQLLFTLTLTLVSLSIPRPTADNPQVVADNPPERTMIGSQIPHDKLPPGRRPQDRSDNSTSAMGGALQALISASRGTRCLPQEQQRHNARVHILRARLTSPAGD